MAQLDAPAGDDPPGADVAMALSAWLSARGQPCAAWNPDPAWLAQPPPTPQLPTSSIATISALVQLRAQVLAQFGLDLLKPAQASGFTRVVATLNARMSALASEAPPLDPAGWVQLANLNTAVDQVQSAHAAGLLAPPPSQMQALTQPGGVPLSQWGALLRPLRMLAPLIAASLQLDADVGDTAQLAAALRVLARITLPTLAAPGLAANLVAALSATASLQASLGAPVLQQGLPAAAQQVQSKLDALLAALSQTLAQDPQDLTPDALLAMLPKLPVSPGSLATPDVVQLALKATALASVTWNVPTSLPAIATGLTTCNLAAQMQAALGIQAVLAAPCGGGCDAAALLRATVAL
jgi:hypothetical protein